MKSFNRDLIRKFMNNSSINGHLGVLEIIISHSGQLWKNAGTMPEFPEFSTDELFARLMNKLSTAEANKILTIEKIVLR